MSATTLSIKEIKFKMAMETLREVSPTLYQAIADYIKKEEPVCYEPGQSCPSCHTGTLVLRDKSAKPFIGCSNYKSGCKFSASCTEEQAKLWKVKGQTGYDKVYTDKSPADMFTAPFTWDKHVPDIWSDRPGKSPVFTAEQQESMDF